MSSRVLYFPAVTTEVTSRLHRLYSQQCTNPMLREFFHGAIKRLRFEAQDIMTSSEKDRLGHNFTDVLQLLEINRTCCYEPTQLVLSLLIQIGEFIIFEDESRINSGSKATDQPVGAGVGLLSAAIVAVSCGAGDTAQLGQDVVAIGFRLAVHLYRRAQHIEDVDGAWEYEVAKIRDIEDLRLQLREFNAKLPVHRHAYIGSVEVCGAKVKLFGPPSTMQKLRSEALMDSMMQSETNPQPRTIYAMHLSSVDVHSILQPLQDQRGNRSVTLRLHSPSDGAPYEATSLRDLLASIVANISGHPANIQSLATAVLANQGENDAHTLDFVAFGTDKDKVAEFAAGVSTTLDLYLSCHSASDYMKTRQHNPNGIAIVGMSGRFPEADGVEELWELLDAGKSTMKSVPTSRFSSDQDPSREARFGNFIKSPGAFDHACFAISPVEAMQLDPVQRMALMVTQEALEMAGYAGCNTRTSPDPSRIAVYFGQTVDDWKSINQQGGINTHYLPAVNRSFIPGRISRHFGWSGGFYSIDTGCSSSATCLSLASDALSSGQIDMAVVGGGTLLTSPEWFEGLGKGGFLSETGACKTFAETADGYCRGEAVAMVVLKRVGDAVKTNDNILATIASSARNSNARSSASMTGPSREAQEALYRAVLRDAGVGPSGVDYVEAHGTGTQAGDSIEMAALTNVLTTNRTTVQPLIIGAVKASIGHSEAAAGVVSLIKAILVLQHNRAPPQPGWPFQLNRKFGNLSERNIEIAAGQKLRSVVDDGRIPRSILVNSFDAAGGNVSIVVQDPPYHEANMCVQNDPRSHHIVVVSSHSEASCRDLISDLREHLMVKLAVDIPSLAFSTTARRIHKAYRRAYVINSTAKLRAILDPNVSPLKLINVDPTIVFVFTGQGSQYKGMGATLYRTSPAFQILIDSYEQICRLYGYSFLDFITNRDATKVYSSGVQQVATVALEIALAYYMISLGVRPKIVLGHSIGEYAALCIAGVLSVNDVFWLLHQRNLLLEQNCRPSSHRMLFVSRPAQELEHRWGQRCEVSCFNGPCNTVISGTCEAINAFENELKMQGIKTTRLQVDYAFHSSQMDLICGPLETLARSVTFQRAQIPIASTVIGRVIGPNEHVFDASYLLKHTRYAVQFSAAVKACEQQNIIQDDSLIIEIGPHPTGIALLESNLQITTPKAIPTLQRGSEDWYGISLCLSAAYEAGVEIAWDDLHRPYAPHLKLLQLPLTNFNLREFWQPYKSITHAPREIPDDRSNKGENILPSTSLQRVQRVTKNNSVNAATFYSNVARKDLKDAIGGHVVAGIAICPASIFIDMAFSAACYLANDGLTLPGAISGYELVDLKMSSPLMIGHEDHQGVIVDATFDADEQTASIKVFSADEKQVRSPQQYSACQVSLILALSKKWEAEWTKISHLIASRYSSIGAMKASQKSTLSCALFYHLFSQIVDYSEPYRTIKEATIPIDFREATAIIEYDSLVAHSTTGNFLSSPYVADAVVHLAGFLLNANPTKPKGTLHISNRIESLRVICEIRYGQPYHVYTAIRDVSKATADCGVDLCDVYVFKTDYSLVMACEGIQFQRVDSEFFHQIAGGPPTAKEGDYSGSQLQTPSSSMSSSPNSIPSSSSTSLASPYTPDPLGMLISIISDKSGQSIHDIETSRSFGDIGVDSQLSISILAEFKKHTGIELPIALLASSSTVGNVRGELEHAYLSTHPSKPAPISTRSGYAVQSSTLDPKNSSPGDELCQLAAKTLGLELHDISDSATWQSLGLDSMQSIRILSSFRKQSNIELPAALFMDYPTVAGVRQHLSASADRSKKEIVSQHGYKVFGDPVGETGPTSRAILCQGSPCSTEAPLFMLCDGSGTTEAYIHFPRLPGGRRIYGLESPFVDNPTEFSKLTRSELSRIFIKTIRSIQPHGPYYIGGWSIGGKYAYEISRQLSLAGEVIALLLLLDTRAPRPRPVCDYISIDTVEDIGFMGAQDIGFANAQRTNMIEELTRRERDHLHASVVVNTREQTQAFAESQNPPRICGIIWAGRGLNEHPDPRRHNPAVTRKAAMGKFEEEELAIRDGGVEELRMVYKSWFFGKRDDFGSNAWENWVGSRARIEVRKVDGVDHFTMVSPPGVYELGKIIVELIVQATDSL